MLSWTRITVSALVLVGISTTAGVVLLRHTSTAPSAHATLPQQPPPAPPAASMRYLPANIQRALVSLCSGCSFADSNGKWNSTDVIMDDRLPSRRLRKTERRGSEWLIEYEHGGIFTGHHVVVLSATVEPTLQPGSSCVPTSAEACKW